MKLLFLLLCFVETTFALTQDEALELAAVKEETERTLSALKPTRKKRAVHDQDFSSRLAFGAPLVTLSASTFEELEAAIEGEMSTLVEIGANVTFPTSLVIPKGKTIFPRHE